MLYVEVQKVTPIMNYGCCCCMLYQFYLSVGSSLSMICIRFSILRVWVAEITVNKKHQRVNFIILYINVCTTYIFLISPYVEHPWVRI
jgi:hypothetical protein